MYNHFLTATKMTQSEIEVDGNIIINGKAYPAIKLLEALNRLGALSFDNENAQLILNDMPIQPVYGSIRKNTFSLLCYHSLAYCCPRTHKCDNREATLKRLNISPNEYSRIKDDHHSHFLEFEHAPSHTTHNENSPSRVNDNIDLSSFFGNSNEESKTEKENTDDFLKKFLSGSDFDSNNLWDSSLNQKEVRFGRKNVPPSTETGLRHMSYSSKCPRCRKRNTTDDKFCSRCGAELRAQ
jgi:predicted metal-binding transcription factor (methanogenesis marker protein 9)